MTPLPALPDIGADPRVHDLVRRALEEDHVDDDVTTDPLVPTSARATARILAREACTVAGGPLATCVFASLDSAISCTQFIPDGTSCGAGAVLLELEGPARGILTGERTALNFMQRMTGIATLTAAFVKATEAHGVQILDTRKTTPTLRILEKYAVLCGGGTNHRMALHDRVLIKDNHRRFWRKDDTPTLDAAIEMARAAHPGIPIEVEVESTEELQSALRANPDWVLLDNMNPEQLRTCVALARGNTLTEASGGITLATAPDVAATGVDAISLGCLTHSAPAADLSLEWRDEGVLSS